MKVNIYLRSDLDANGKAKLFFFLSGNGIRIKIYSGCKCHPDSWNGSQIRKTKNDPRGDLDNTILQTKLSILNKIISTANLNLVDISPNEVKSKYLSVIEGNPIAKLSDPVFIGMADSIPIYQQKYKDFKEASTLRGMNQVKTHLEKFRKGCHITDVDQDFLNDYCQYLINEGLQDSSIKFRHIKTIKELAKEAVSQGIHVDPSITRFTWKAIEKIPFSATWKEVQDILAITDFALPIHRHIRDRFIVSCYTGLRDSDLRNIRPEMISKQNGRWMLRVVMQKTGFDYHIPLAKEAYQILKSYEFNIPSYAQQTYNEKLKIIVRPVIKGVHIKTKSSGSNKSKEEVSRHKMFTTHTGRRTFGRRFIDQGGSIVLLSKLFGHKNIETTLKYIGYQPGEVVDAFINAFG